MNSDDQIIRGCMDGKRKAFSLLFQNYAPVMLGVCMRYCKNRIDAEDVMQDGFIKVFSQIHKFRREGSFEGWIKRIMINAAIDNYQSNLKHAFHEDVSEIAHSEDMAEYPGSDDDLPDEMNIPHTKLMEMIQELPDGYRVVFNLFAIENFNHKEIASLLGISENTSKTQLLKARKALRKKIEALLQHRINRVTTV
ncbi:MAG: RNA polymerase sigma factor [Bacteroidales bacterium]|nr:RNA polymerase sigma factor [Bacteroidales bacterium]